MGEPFMHGSPEYERWLREDREREDREAEAKAKAEAGGKKNGPTKKDA